MPDACRDRRGADERSRRHSPIRRWLPRRSPRRRSARQMTLRLVFAAALLAASGLGRARPLAAQTDVIRGRVTSASAGDMPIEGASVTATTLTGGVNRSARTDRNGRYTITFPGAEGDYFVTVIAIGYVPRRFEVKRTADQDILIADTRLTLSASTLDTIVTVGRRDRPLRGDTLADIGGMDRIVNTTNVAVEQLGDLAAMAASTPGLHLHRGRRRRPVRLCGARTRAVAERPDDQWHEQHQLQSAARRELLRHACRCRRTTCRRGSSAEGGRTFA